MIVEDCFRQAPEIGVAVGRDLTLENDELALGLENAVRFERPGKSYRLEIERDGKIIPVVLTKRRMV